MRRLFSFATVLIVLFTITAGARIAAQDATPEVVELDLTGDMTFHEFADFGVVDAATMPAAPVSIILFRIEFAPGAGVSYPPGDPGLGVHLVESGTLTLRDFDTDIVITRAEYQATPDAKTSETLLAGDTTQLLPGDGFLWPPFAAGAFTNDGDEPVLLLISNMYPPMPEQPAVDAGAATATP